MPALRVIRSTIVAALAMAMAVCAGVATPALAIDANLQIETATIGAFPGESTLPGREDTIQLLGYADRLTRAFDPLTGAPTGGPQCGPLVIRKLVDRTSPLFVQAFATSDITTTFQLVFYQSGNPYFQISLTNARVATIAHAGAENDAVPAEQISFIYQMIEYVHLPTGLTSIVSCLSGS